MVVDVITASIDAVNTTDIARIDLSSIMQGLTLGILLWFWNQFHQIKDRLAELTRETKEWQAKVDVAMFGVTGTNGMHGMSKDHEVRLRLLEHHGKRHDAL